MGKYSLLIFFSFLITNLFAQYSNSSGETIYELEKAKATQATFTGNEITFGFNYETNSRIFTIKDSKSSVKSDVIGIRIGIVNSKSLLDLDDFDIRDFGFKTEIGQVWTIKDSIYDMDRRATTGSIKLKYQMDRFMLYDPQKKEVSTENPSDLSLLGNVTWYLDSYKYAISLSAAINIITYNKLGLKNNFKNNSSISQDSNVTFFESFDGKYGTLDSNLNGTRFTASIPFFFEERIFSWDRMPYLSPVFYVSQIFTKDLKPSQNIGFSFNFLGERPFEDQKFTLPTSVGLGFDWTHFNSQWSKANIFLYGSITLN